MSNVFESHTSDDDEPLIRTTISRPSTGQPSPGVSRQQTINQSHPFGLKLWKASLHPKSRSIEQQTTNDVHAAPAPLARTLKQHPISNTLWAICFGLPLASMYLFLAAMLLLLTLAQPKGRQYSSLALHLAGFMLWPFGRYIKREGQNNHLSLPRFNHRASLLAEEHAAIAAEVTFRARATENKSFMAQTKAKFTSIVKVLKRFTYADWVYHTLIFVTVLPLHLIVSLLNFLCIVTIPMYTMQKVLVSHMLREPLQLSVKTVDQAVELSTDDETDIVLCMVKAAGAEYLKYTVDGVNVIFINLIPIALLALLLDYTHAASSILIFGLCLVGVIPLAYFMGQAVAAISAQSTLALGAVLNAIFASIVEVLLYAFAIIDGKGELVEGAIVGSLLATLLLLPGLSMIAGGIKHKEQRFNAKSQNVSTVLLIMTLIGAFIPTMFYQAFGSYELKCDTICETDKSNCTGCHYIQPNPATDPFYLNSVKPLMYICAAILPLAYLIGCIFTLRTHTEQIYTQQEPVEDLETGEPHSEGGHEAPSWSKGFSTAVLVVCTVVFAAVAEVLVKHVDEVIPAGGNIKFVGFTLFALVPSVTEFVNAMAFAAQGNIALSLEIGSQYVAQIATLQIPAVFAFAMIYNSIYGLPDDLKTSFTLLFSRFDMISVLLSILLLSYVFMEGKSNYFKGTILTFAYLIFVGAAYYSPMAALGF